MIKLEPHKENGFIKERMYEATLYEDSTIYDCKEVIERVKKLYPFWAYIEHNRDIFEDTGELKKAHIHLLFRNDNAVYISSVANKLGIPENAIEWKSDIKLSVQYLVHKNNPNKAQYDYHDIQSSLEPDILEAKFFSNNKQKILEQTQKLFEYCMNERITRMSDLMYFALSNDCYLGLKQNSYIFSNLIRENTQYYKDRN